MKKYNWKKGSLFIVVCAIIGFFVGWGIKFIEASIPVHMVVSSVKEAMSYLDIIAFISGMIGLGTYFYFNARLKQENYSNEEGSFYERNEKLMGVAIMCATLAAVINFTAFGINILSDKAMGSLFIVNVLLAFFGEVGHISLTKKVRPELDADPLKVDFNRDYFEKLDEYEKTKVGKASMRTLTAMTPVYVVLFLVCYAVTMVLGISPIVCLPIGMIWAVQTILYTYYSVK